MGRICNTITDAIAIKAINPNTILVGKGNELHLFVLENKYSEYSEKLNESISSKSLNIKLLTHNIYGIELTNDVENVIVNRCGLLLIYGGREFLLSTINQGNFIEKVRFCEIYRAHLTDWITAARILQTEDYHDHEFVLLTAHSVILRFKGNRNTNCYELLERISSEDKSVLYCSKISGHLWQELVIFSGNAFGEILIWQPHINFNEAYSDSDSVPMLSKKIKRSRVMKRLVAHKGVLFSIDYNKSCDLLVTTSDDRSTKWFHVKLPKNHNTPLWSKACIQPVVSVFGHGARVFKGCVIDNECNNGRNYVNTKKDYYILSAGEDSCFCLWNSDGKLLLKRRQQYGATIWNFIYMKKTQTVFTIGSAGNLIAYDLSMMIKEQHINIENNNIAPLLHHVTCNRNEYFAKIRFLNINGDIIVGITNHNHIFHLQQTEITTNPNGDWTPWKIHVDFKCTVFEVWIETDYSLLALGGHHRLILLKINFLPTLSKTIILDDKLPCGLIRSFIFLSRDCYLIGDNTGHILLLQEGGENLQLLPKQSKSFSKEKETWPIAALYLNCNPQSGHKEHILISTRQGFLILFSRRQQDITKNFIEKTCIRHPHGNFGATCIQLQYQDQNQAIVCTYGRNNMILWYKIDLYLSNMELMNLERFPICWTAAIVQCKQPTHLENLIIGFNDNHLVIWSRQHNILSEFPCGGGYRSWHYCLLIDELKATHLKVIYVKAKTIFQYKMPIYNRALTTTTALVKRWHIAACNAIECTNSGLLVTAGEDNLIKLWYLIQSTGEIQFYQDLYFHISSVKAIKLLQIARESYILFSGGGRGQFCITRIKQNPKQCQIKLLLSHTLSPSASTTSINCLETYNYKTDVRIMAMDVLMAKESVEYIYKIYLGCSDGYVRCLHFNLLTGKMMQENAIDIINYKRCILHLHTISSLNCLMTATTDGKLQYYNLNNLIPIPELEIKYHSAIMALDILHRKDQSIIQILCGGDDQSVIYMEYFCNDFHKISSDIQSKVFSKRKYICRNDLHSSQVTGVAIEENGLYGFTAGIDRIIYQLHLQNDCLVIRSFQSSIADIKGINNIFLKANKLYYIIFGNGIEIYTPPNNFSSTMNCIDD